MLSGTGFLGTAFLERVPFRRNEETPPLHFASLELEQEVVAFLMEQKKERRFFFPPSGVIFILFLRGKF
ncbi:MAG: hypothetical protein O7D30_03760 [Rickettsia endosymbiont of Ixodes persulcatus]|nr:hypothetical protein [Rickettsia endosymbiont of Ixodes persulcatus]